MGRFLFCRPFGTILLEPRRAPRCQFVSHTELQRCLCLQMAQPRCCSLLWWLCEGAMGQHQPAMGQSHHWEITKLKLTTQPATHDRHNKVLEQKACWPHTTDTPDSGPVLRPELTSCKTKGLSEGMVSALTATAVQTLPSWWEVGTRLHCSAGVTVPVPSSWQTRYPRLPSCPHATSSWHCRAARRRMCLLSLKTPGWQISTSCPFLRHYSSDCSTKTQAGEADQPQGSRTGPPSSCELCLSLRQLGTYLT